MFILPVFLARGLSWLLLGLLFASGVNIFCPRELPRRRLFFMQSASTRMLTGPSLSSALAQEPSRPRFSPTPWPRPTLTLGTPSAVSLVRLFPRMTGASPALASPLEASALARLRRTPRRLTSPACPPRPPCPLVPGPPSMSTIWIPAACALTPAL